MWNVSPVSETLLNPWFSMMPPNQATWLPRLDAWEDEAEILIEMEMAGVDPESIEIELDEARHSFTVQGKRLSPEGRKAIYRELPSGNLHRMVPLPWATSELEASYAEGLLQVRVPKPAEKSGTTVVEARKVKPKKVATVKM